MGKITGRSILAFLAGMVLLCAASFSSAAGVDKILCVPWMGNVNLPHTAISGQQVNLNAVIYGDATGGSVSYSWDFMDGTSATGTISVPANGIYNLQVSHIYNSALNTPFDTKLTLDGKSDIYKIIIAPDQTDSKTNIALDKALWYLHGKMIRTNAGSPSVAVGYWNENGFYVGSTGAAVWAFEVQGHLLSVEANTLDPVEDPYVEDVQRGINIILSRTYYQAMNMQTKGHPEDYNGDGNGNEGNGYGLVSYSDGNHTNYEQGLAMGALAGSGTPLATAATGQATYVFGRAYRDIVQDMVDWYSWSQIDGSSFPLSGALGGWYYTAADNGQWPAGYGDNSAAQWAYIGLDAAVKNFGVTLPLWVKTQLAGYLHNQIGYGNRGWLSYRADSNSYPIVCLTSGALIGMALVGETVYDTLNGPGSYATDLANVRLYLGNNWHGTEWRSTENWYGHRAYYTMYAVMKGLRLQGIDALPGSPGTTDWYRDYVGVMLPDQNTDGHWRGTGWIDGYLLNDMGTAFGVLILTPSVFSPPPVACYNAQPNPGYLDVPIIFNPSCSYHSDSAKSIVLYEWDFNNDGIYDVSSVTPGEQTHSWDSGNNSLGSYPVTLRVTDDSNPSVTDTYVIDVQLTLPPHPPVADVGGPYVVSFCSNDSLALDGSGSYDIDEGQSEGGAAEVDTITAYGWDMDGAPWNFANASGETFLLDSAALSSSLGVGANTIGLKVTDNTSKAYPGSGKPDLTSENFDSVTVQAGCLCDLAARAKSGKVQLTWTHTGVASYDVYRSTTGPNTGFSMIAENIVTTYATYLDGSVVNGTRYWYRVVGSDGCGSQGVNITPVATRTR